MSVHRAILLVVSFFCASVVCDAAPGDWGQTQKILAPAPAQTHWFGFSVSVHGETALIGAGLSEDVHVFVRAGAVWAPQDGLTANDGALGDGFGGSACLDGDTALIGASGDDDKGTDSGSAYVFTRVGGVWTQQAKLTAADGAAGDRFGGRVSLDGDTALVGASESDGLGSRSGSAYVFVRSGDTWTQQAKLTAADGAANDFFGESVCVDGDTALIGSPTDDDDGLDSGSAYVFTRSGTLWSVQAKLTSDDAAAFDQFGKSVSLDGDTALIGAHRDDVFESASTTGSAYVFTRSGDSWTQQAKLKPASAAPGTAFGNSVSLDGDRALVAAAMENMFEPALGSAHVFERRDGVWTEMDELKSDDGVAGDYYGDVLSLSGDTALIGAYEEVGDGAHSGSAYFFELDRGVGPTDITLTNATIAEHEAPGSVVGTLDAVDADDTSGFRFDLVSGPGDAENDEFVIVGDQLQTAFSLDFESGASRSIRVLGTDPLGNAFAKSIVISVANITSDDDDGDGLTEAEELAAGTNQFVADSDHDGIDDGDEVHGWRTDPTSSSSVFSLEIRAVDAGAGTVTLRFTTVSGVTYVVQGSSTLPGPWREIPGAVAGSGNHESKIVDLNVFNERFFRVSVVP